MGAFYLGFDFCEYDNTLTSLCTGTHRLKSYCVEENATRWDCVRRRRLLGWKFPAFVFKYSRPVAPHGLAVTPRQTLLKARYSQEKVLFVFFLIKAPSRAQGCFSFTKTWSTPTVQIGQSQWGSDARQVLSSRSLLVLFTIVNQMVFVLIFLIA